MTKQPEPLLWLDSARGQYIPRDFANSFRDRATAVANVDAEQWAILEAGPNAIFDGANGLDNFYWEVWNEVCDRAIVTDEDGIQYAVYQDGDCWLIPEGMEYSEETDFYVWPQDDEAYAHDAEDQQRRADAREGFDD